MSKARTGLEGQVVSMMRAIRERGRVEAEALAPRLEQEGGIRRTPSEPSEARARRAKPDRLAVPPTG
jgi:hypothetical protein